MRTWIGGLCLLGGAVLVAASLLPLVETNVWWVRVLDFPRLQYLIGLAAVAVLLLLVRGWSGRVMAFALVGMAGAATYNLVKLAPYVADRTDAATCPAPDSFSVMVANVRLGHHDTGGLLETVRANQPDLFLALETDEWWDRTLADLSDDMPYHVQRITGSYFGIHLLSRHPLDQDRTLLPVEQDAPAILADMALPGGEPIRFVGLHPRPPHRGQSSTGRDAQLLWGGLQAREAEGRPLVLAGDLNAVPWERTIERMARIGALLDPRVDAGFVPSYDARSWWMVWPLDHILHSAQVRTISFKRLPDFGSDHYPVLADLCRAPSPRMPPELRSDDLTEAETTLDAARAGKAEVVGD